MKGRLRSIDEPQLWSGNQQIAVQFPDRSGPCPFYARLALTGVDNLREGEQTAPSSATRQTGWCEPAVRSCA